MGHRAKSMFKNHIFVYKSFKLDIYIKNAKVKLIQAEELSGTQNFISPFQKT